MSDHTPTPWRYSGLSKASNFAQHSGIVYAEGCNLARVRGGIADDRGVAEANARFIVRACNAHDDLLAALKVALPRVAARVIGRGTGGSSCGACNVVASGDAPLPHKADCFFHAMELAISKAESEPPNEFERAAGR